MNNKYPQISFVFDRRKIATSTIKSSVDMRICYDSLSDVLYAYLSKQKFVKSSCMTREQSHKIACQDGGKKRSFSRHH